VGEHARQIQDRLAERLAAALPDAEWTVERSVGADGGGGGGGGTPVDVVGESEERLVLVELEWRRADPANNTATLFRHLAEGGALRRTLEDRDAVVVQLFTSYYDLASGGVSSKRKDATFVGAAAEEYLETVAYQPIDLPIDPPNGGGTLPDGWSGAVDAAVESIVSAVGGSGRE